MRKYNVEIEETLTKIIEVEAESEWDAMVQIENKYHNSEIVLSADDFFRL